MTRKDYELIAGIISRAWIDRKAENTNLAYYATGNNACVRAIAEQFALELERNNTRFDRSRFLKACGVIETNF